MSTKPARIVTGLEAALSSLSGVSVFVGRDDPIDSKECPAINVRPPSTEREPLGAGFEQIDCDVELELHVRGADTVQLSEALFEQAHLLVMGDATLAAIGSGPRRQGGDTEGDAAEGDPARLRITYRWTWASPLGAA